MADELNTEEVSVEELAQAQQLGWAPKDKWRGAPEKWVDAKQFLAKGMGIHHVRGENQRLAGQLSVTTERLAQMEEALKGANAAIEALQESSDADVKAQVEAARKELKAEIATASREGDHEALAEATDKLTQLNAAEERGDKGKQDDKGDKGGDKGRQIHPEIAAWYTKNPDLISNPRWRALATVEAAELRGEGEVAVGAAFMDKVAERVDKVLGGTGRGHSKVEGDNGGGNRSEGGKGGGGKKSYADLPAEAKAACDKMSARLVGPNRAHKDVASWRASYAKQYFTE